MRRGLAGVPFNIGVETFRHTISSSYTRAMGRFMHHSWYDLNRTPKRSGAFLRKDERIRFSHVFNPVLTLNGQILARIHC